MKKIISISAIILAAVSFLTGCKVDIPEVITATEGPKMTVSCDNSAYMGSDIHFSVSLQDAVALSTLKVELLFDDSVVATSTIRTKEYGTYEDVIGVPLYANIPDGTATVRFTAQNVGLAKTEQSVDVQVSRPNPAYLTLVCDGKEYKMEKTGDYCYEVTDYFTQSLKSTLITPDSNITLGWNGSAIDRYTFDEIPFYNGADGIYTVSVNLLSLTASPFGKTVIKITEDEPVLVTNLCQNTVLEIDGIPGISIWNLDWDYFAVEGTSIKWKPVSGLYKLVADFDGKFIRVDPVYLGEDGSARYFSDFNADKGTEVLYAIGDGIGKNNIKYSWNTGDGAWALAEIAPDVWCITLKAGKDINTGANFKFFSSRGWGGELGYGNYASIDMAGTGYVGDGTTGDNGNIYIKSLEVGKGYSFIVDLTGGRDAAKLTVETVDLPLSGLDIKVNGAQATMIDENHYTVAKVAINKGDQLSVSGIDDILSYWMDPDYINPDYTFNAMSGYYLIEIYLDRKFAEFKRVNANGDKATTTDSHGCWLMAWGLANWIYSKDGVEGGATNELAFNPGSSYCMAEVSDNVYQFSGYAVTKDDNTTLGGRFRYDYISAKYFGQDSWGNEKGSILGSASTVQYTDRALTLLANKTGGDNLELASGVTLELGAYYVLTFDFSTPGIELIDFYKK